MFLFGFKYEMLWNPKALVVLDTGSCHTLPYDRINRMQSINYFNKTKFFIGITLHMRDEKSKKFYLYAVQSLKRGD